MESLVTSLVTSTIVTSLAAFIFKGYASNIFSKKLENHKNELQILSDRQRNEFQKQIHDFTLFNSKKHEVYPELYYLTLEAVGYISSLTGLTSKIDFTEYSGEDLRIYLTKKNMLNKKIEELVMDLETDPVAANEEIQRYLSIVEPQIAERKFNDAKRYFLLNELYLNNETSEVYSKCLKTIGNLIVDTEQFFMYDTRPEISFHKQKENINEVMKEVKEKFRSELSRSEMI